MSWSCALSGYLAAVLERSEKFTEATERRADLAFWNLVKIAAPTLPDLIVKAQIMLTEYGETGDLRTDLVEVLIQDVIGLSYGTPT